MVRRIARIWLTGASLVALGAGAGAQTAPGVAADRASDIIIELPEAAPPVFSRRDTGDSDRPWADPAPGASGAPGPVASARPDTLPAEKDMIVLDPPPAAAALPPPAVAAVPPPVALPSPHEQAPVAAPPVASAPVAAPPGDAPPGARADLPPAHDAERLPAPAAPSTESSPSIPQAAPVAAPAPQPPVVAPAPQVAEAPPVTPDMIRAAVDGFLRAAAPQTRREREAVAAAYAARGHAPFWLDAGRPTAAAAAASARLTRAEDDGLDLRAYVISSFRDLTPQQMAEADLALSLAVVAYGRQATGARVEPSRVSALITAKPQVADAATILNLAVQAGASAGEALQAFNPPHPGYAALRAKLAELRRERPAPIAQAKIPAGPVLKVGMRDPRVPLIRARFGLDVGEATAPEQTVYDTRIAAAIADFQRANGLPASGQLTARTISVLSGGEPSRLENEILANMERWRWLPRDLGASRIEVNIPDFTLRLTRDGVTAHETRVVVGKPDTPTPVFSNRMQYVIVNPYWNVPPSILKNEMLPRLARDPSYLARRGYEVTQRKGQISVRQPPGAGNALGHIKFMFPNDHAVYLHDTPSRSLFGTPRRAYSHGCVRVDKPFALAEAVLGRANGWSEERVKRMVGGGERTIHLPQHLPIHIEYFTAWVDETGRLQLRDDIYGYSARVRAALGLDG